MKKLFFTIAAIFMLNLVSAASLNQNHAVYIYNFIKYMSWPPSYQAGDFVIGVLGYTPHIKDLHHLATNKKINNQSIIIKVFSQPHDFGKCNILFIPENQSEKIEQCMDLLGKKPTVIITEKIGMAKRGSCINFIMEDNKIQFELNRTTAQNIGVQVKNDLVKLATVELE